MDKNRFDYIICGGGASGLLLTKGLITDPFFAQKSILLIEKEEKNTHDRTWCFWESGNGEFETIVHHRWDNAKFKSSDTALDFPLNPYQYKMIRSGDFYQFMHNKTASASQLTRLQSTVTSITSNSSHTSVVTDQGTFEGGIVFSSIFEKKHLFNQIKYPVLQQHFIGWFIKTENPCFQADQISFMDFDLPQKGETRFIYVLPFSSNEALVEFTLFSKDLLKTTEYEDGIVSYLAKINSGAYTIIEKEKGSIPMSCYPFDKKNKDTLFHIGTAGGWTKASTGFTFQKTLTKTKALITYLKTNKPLSQFEKRNRFWFYDLLFLDVLYRNNELGSQLFSRMFQKLKPKLVFKFLDEKTSPLHELKILSSFPTHYFIKALFKRLF